MQHLQGSEFEDLLVPYRLATLKEDWGDYRQGDEWADPDVRKAAQVMSWLVDTRKSTENAFFER
jgi:hypothetical protein